MQNFLTDYGLNATISFQSVKTPTSFTTPVSELELDPDMLVLDNAESEGNEEDVKAVLEEAVDFSSPILSPYLKGIFPQHAC